MWGILTSKESERDSGNRGPGVWKGLLSLERGVPHLRCLFTPLFTRCQTQLIPSGDRAACPPQGPWNRRGPLWVPNWAYRSADWINSSVCGTFSPPSEEGDSPAAARESRGSQEGVVESGQKTWPSLLANPGWKCELGATRGLSLHRASEQTGLLGAYGNRGTGSSPPCMRSSESAREPVLLLVCCSVSAALTLEIKWIDTLLSQMDT